MEIHVAWRHIEIIMFVTVTMRFMMLLDYIFFAGAILGIWIFFFWSWLIM